MFLLLTSIRWIKDAYIGNKIIYLFKLFLWNPMENIYFSIQMFKRYGLDIWPHHDQLVITTFFKWFIWINLAFDQSRKKNWNVFIFSHLYFEAALNSWKFTYRELPPLIWQLSEFKFGTINIWSLNVSRHSLIETIFEKVCNEKKNEIKTLSAKLEVK